MRKGQKMSKIDKKFRKLYRSIKAEYQRGVAVGSIQKKMPTFKQFKKELKLRKSQAPKGTRFKKLTSDVLGESYVYALSSAESMMINFTKHLADAVAAANRGTVDKDFLLSGIFSAAKDIGAIDTKEGIYVVDWTKIPSGLDFQRLTPTALKLKTALINYLGDLYEEAFGS